MKGALVMKLMRAEGEKVLNCPLNSEILLFEFMIVFILEISIPLSKYHMYVMAYNVIHREQVLKSQVKSEFSTPSTCCSNVVPNSMDVAGSGHCGALVYIRSSDSSPWQEKGGSYVLTF